MRQILLFFAYVAFAAAVTDTEWNTWKVSFGKSYPDTNTETAARAKYDANDVIIKANNVKFAAGQVSFKMAHNGFSDLSFADYSNLLKDTIPTQVSQLDTMYLSTPATFTPSSIDLRESTKIPIVDQGTKCAAGWAFAGTALFEYWLLKRTNPVLDLSEQNAVDCARKDGCQGGWVEDVATYFIENGMNWNSVYPYTGTDNNCRYTNTLTNNAAGNSPYFTPKDYYFVEGHDITIQYALHEYGWTTVCLDARVWQFYKGGIMKATDCGNEWEPKLNHCAVIVGYGEENGSKYWLVRNSWSKNWGEDGYIRLQRGANTCGITNKYNSRITTY